MGLETLKDGSGQHARGDEASIRHEAMIASSGGTSRGSEGGASAQGRPGTWETSWAATARERRSEAEREPITVSAARGGVGEAHSSVEAG